MALNPRSHSAVGPWSREGTSTWRGSACTVSGLFQKCRYTVPGTGQYQRNLNPVLKSSEWKVAKS